jgi:hypothetical protein
MKSNKAFLLLLEHHTAEVEQRTIHATDQEREIASLKVDMQDAHDTGYAAGHGARQPQIEALAQAMQIVTGERDKLIADITELAAQLQTIARDNFNAGVEAGRNSAVTRQVVQTIASFGAPCVDHSAGPDNIGVTVLFGVTESNPS